MVEFRMTLRAKRANRQARSWLNRWRLLLEPLEERLTPALFIPQPTADLAVAQTHAPMKVAPSQATSFSIQVTNKGPGSVSRFNLIDKVPAALQSPTFTPSTGSYNPVNGWWAFTTPLGATQTVTLTLTGTVAASAKMGLVNTVNVTAPAGYIDPVLSNNTSTDARPSTTTSPTWVSPSRTTAPRSRATLFTPSRCRTTVPRT